MSDLQSRIQEEMESLRQLRDELKLQLELGRAEARDKWQDLEGRWGHLEAKARQLRDASKDELAEVGEATKLLAEEIRDGYRKLRDLI